MISIESLRVGDEQAENELDAMSFGVRSPEPDIGDEIPHIDVVAAYDGAELLAKSVMLDGGQYHGGRAVRGPGIASVGVVPHRRGEGLARRVMTETVREAHRRGAAISMLYPTTASLYRSVGYEIAGDHVVRQAPIEAFASTTPTPVDDIVTTSFAIDDLASMADGYDHLARSTPGAVVRSEQWWAVRTRALRGATGGSKVGYFVGARAGDGEGHVVLIASSSQRGILDVSIAELGATGPAVLGTLGAIIARFGTVAGMVRSRLPPWILHALTPEGQRWEAVESINSMLRIVDARRAVAERGWPPVDAAIDLELVDDVIGVNNGRFRLTVHDGVGRLEPGGSGTWRLGIGALASWFSGWSTPEQLQQRSTLTGTGSERDLAVMQALTAGPTPTMAEFF